MLEIGAAFGSMTVLLKDQVGRVTAVEMDPDKATEASARLAGPNAEVLNVSATELPSMTARLALRSASTSSQRPVAGTSGPGPRARRPGPAPGGVFLGWDSLDGPEIRRYHEGDVFVPVDLETFPDRVLVAGFNESRVEPADEGATTRFAARPTRDAAVVSTVARGSPPARRLLALRRYDPTYGR